MKVVKIILSVALLSCFVLSLTVFRVKIGESAKIKETEEFKGVISLWHIDGFEGGTGSRRQFLLDAAAKYEKEHSGVLIMATAHTVNSVNESIKRGIFPDIISFSSGVDIKNAKKLGKTDAFIGGKIGGDTYAVAWCRGGYTLIENPAYKEGKTKKPPVIVSNGDYNFPLVGLAKEYGNTRAELLDGYDTDKPLDAYVKFVGGQYRYLFGTQRDIVRLNNRGFNFTATPIKTFSDLYQYAAVLSSDAQKEIMAKSFVDYLVSEKIQRKLTEIKLFSPYFDMDFGDDILNEMQKIKIEETVSAFISPEKVEDIHGLSAQEILNDIKSGEKLKNILLRP